MKDKSLSGSFVAGLVTTLVSALLLVLVWRAVDTDQDDPPPSGASFVGETSVEQEAPDPATARPPTRLTRCARAVRALEDSLKTARPALKQWGVHVDAMNKLVVGEITLGQAAAFWNRTRVGARQHVDQFREAMGTLRGRGVDCPPPDLLAKGARGLPACARQVEARVAVIRAATTSVDTWDRHIHHMDMMRLGELSPAKATRMWLKMWKRGARDLESYRAAARDAERLAGCEAGRASG